MSEYSIQNDSRNVLFISTLPAAPAAPPRTTFNSAAVSAPIIRTEIDGHGSPDEPPMKANMSPGLEDELGRSVLLGVPGLVENLFPDTTFPIAFQKLYDAVYRKHWTVKYRNGRQFSAHFCGKKLGGVDTISSAKTDLSITLNDLGETITDAVRKELPLWTQSLERMWITATQKPQQKNRSIAKQKPDICLVHNGEGASISWASALVPLEFREKAHDCVNAFIQLTNNALTIFSKQEERRFVVGVSICGDDVRAYIFDRAGVVGSLKFDLNYQPAIFIRLIAGLILSDLNGIGLDTSISLGENGFRSITVGGAQYQIIKKLFISESIRGRGTICWHAQRCGQDYVIKDAWTDVSKIQTEVELLKAAHGIPNVAQLVAEEVVKIGDIIDSTANIRSIISKDYPDYHWYQDVKIRLHRRIITTPVAEPLTSFRSKRELLQVLISAIEAHFSLFERNILHRDISINNVLIYRGRDTPETSIHDKSSSAVGNESEEKQHVRAILIDFDYSIITRDKNGEKIQRSAGPATGTIPFMAVELLTGLQPGEEHEPHHDLESFFYILLWIALSYAGPHGVERRDINVEKANPVKGWVAENTDLRDLGISKLCSMSVLDRFFDGLVANLFTKYFKDLVPCINELRHRLFSIGRHEPEKMTHQDMINILRKHLALLPEVENWSEKDDEEGYTGKRKIIAVEEDYENDQAHEFATQRKRARVSEDAGGGFPTDL